MRRNREAHNARLWPSWLAIGIGCSACMAADAAAELPRADAHVSAEAGETADARPHETSADGHESDSSGLEEPRVRSTLVDHDRWREVIGGDNPFGAIDGTAPCPRAAYFATVLAGEFAFEIETSRCGFITVVQPTLVDVRAGDLVKARLWHFELVAGEPSEARVAFHFGGVASESSVPIPSPSGLLAPKWHADRDVPRGTPLYYHLENHGANDWVLIELTTGP